MKMSTGQPPWSLELEPEETWLLGILLDVYQPLVDPDDEVDSDGEADRTEDLDGPEDGDADDDCFDFWESDLSPTVIDRDHEDPALRRLFPDAYPDDALASAEFRRFTLAGQRRERLDDIAFLRRALDALDEGPLIVQESQIDQWLRVANALRLVLASRLGIVDETTADQAERTAEQDPSDIVHPAYEWLGVLIEILIEVSWGQD
ncbi:Domain of uncharacterised function (DUF2017) [Acidipropionibacterium jensenii]|uniref:Domain of uncharacterized function (DUF2017) n=2 Tax=Acidipropionibacterium jensenii TaxID=1749 RepID=A0A3S4VL13_9ACTN|nr:Domain of uncharacterised function (DUF2017) [Acidipropionibacterium jensenii]